jgi:hypothetical protein
LRVDRYAQPFEDLGGVIVHRAAVDPPPCPERLPADEDVLRDREVREHDRLLIDDRDAGVP